MLQYLSGCHWKINECCFMKQKYHFQRGVLQYENATMPLSSSGIHTTHQHFQKRYITLFLLKGLKSYQPKYKCKVYFTKEIYTFKLRQLITFETLELKQSYIPHLKVLMCGINASGAQWCGHISTSCYTHLKLELLLHKRVLVTFLLASTVNQSFSRS